MADEQEINACKEHVNFTLWCKIEEKLSKTIAFITQPYDTM